jgi:DNA-binding helix-hairpin-helix protein with protein kinase domain
MLQRDSISPIKDLEKFKSNIFFTYSYNNNNNNYNIYINKNIAISFATLSTIGFAFIFKNLFLQ